MIAHPSFADGNARTRHHTELEAQLIAALSKRTRAEWLAALEAAEVPTGPINDIPTIVEDPQVTARGLIKTVGDGTFVGQPIHFSTYPDTSEQPAPALGEHTDMVLAELGYSADEIAAMKTEGVI